MVVVTRGKRTEVSDVNNVVSASLQSQCGGKFHIVIEVQPDHNQGTVAPFSASRTSIAALLCR